MKHSIETREIDKKITAATENLTFWKRVKNEMGGDIQEDLSPNRSSNPVPRRPGRPTLNKKTEGWTKVLPKVLSAGPLTVREIQAGMKVEGYPVIYQTIYGACKRGIERGEIVEIGNRFQLVNN